MSTVERWGRHRGLFELPKRLVNFSDWLVDVGGGEGDSFVSIFGGLVWVEIVFSDFSGSIDTPVGSVGVDVLDQALFRDLILRRAEKEKKAGMGSLCELGVGCHFLGFD